MHRQRLLNTLHKLFSHTNKTTGVWFSENTVQSIFDFVTGNANCFERSNKGGHITGSALVTTHDLKQVLLTHHKKLNKWLQLGGHADGESDCAKVAFTEAFEESGLPQDSLQFLNWHSDNTGDVLPFDLDVHLIPATAKENEHYHYDIRYLIFSNKPHLIQVSDESNSLRWFTIEEARQLTQEQSMLRQFEKLEWLQMNFFKSFK